VDEEQHPQLQRDIEDNRGQARQAGELSPGDLAKRQSRIPQQRRKHPKIGISFAIAGKHFKTDRVVVNGKVATEQVDQHVVENLIQHLRGEELEGAVAQQEQVIDGDTRYQDEEIPSGQRAHVAGRRSRRWQKA